MDSGLCKTSSVSTPYNNYKMQKKLTGNTANHLLQDEKINILRYDDETKMPNSNIQHETMNAEPCSNAE